MDPVRRDDAYPSMPMQLGKRGMHKTFVLEAVPGDAELEHIRFHPVKDPEKDFSGELWIDRKTGTLVKTDITIKNAAKHPFLPLFPCDTISNVDISVSRTYRQEEGVTLPDHISFNYHVTYKSIRNKPDSLHDNTPLIVKREISTTGIVSFYDYGDAFILPYFTYDPDYDDYRKISIIPFNEFFWDHNNTLLLTDNQKESLGFLAREGSMFTWDNREYGKDFLINLKTNGKRIFQNYYTFWSPIRRILPNREFLAGNPNLAVMGKTEPLSSLYNLKAQVLLDVNRLNDSLYCMSYTVFDGKESFYELGEHPATKAFLNIYFDLCEIERQKMQAELDSKSYTATQIDSLYLITIRRISEETKRYLSEVNLGKDETALFKWNKVVISKLGIDNLALFPVGKK